MKKRNSGNIENHDFNETTHSDFTTFTPEQISAATQTRTNPLLTLSKKVASAASGEKNLPKKMKTLYDPKSNSKSRFSALEEILDTIQDVDIPLFYRENIDVIFEVLSNVFMKQVSKIKQKTNPTINSKEISSLLKTLPILKQIFIYLSNRVQQGWEEDTLVLFFTQLLHYGNHPKLRKEGFGLLLTWLSILKQPTEGSIWLYRNSIPLDVYSFDRLNDTPHVVDLTQSGYLHMDQELIHLDDRTPLVPNTHPPSYFDSNELFQILLTNLAQLSYIVSGSGLPFDLELTQEDAKQTLFPPEDYLLGLSMDSANASLKFMFDLFQKYYLAKLFVEQGKELLPSVSLKDFVGFEKCPPSLLHVLIKFLVRNCLDDDSKLLGLSTGQVTRTQQSPVCPILKKTFFGTSLSRSFVNEIIHQSLSLAPYGFSTMCMESVRSAILIIGTWFRSNAQERPVFMRNSIDHSDQVSIFDEYVQMYLEMVHSALTWEVCFSTADKTQSSYMSSPDFSSEQESKLTSISSKASLSEFTELQTIITDSQNIFSGLCKDFVCQSLLEINERLIYIISTSPLLMPSFEAGKMDLKSKSLAHTLENLYETLFYAWSVSKVDNQELWLLFQKSMTKSTVLTPLIQNWMLTLRRLTCLLANKLYDVEFDPNSAELDDLILIGSKRNKKPNQKPNTKNAPVRFNNAHNLGPEILQTNKHGPTDSNSHSNTHTPFKRGYSFSRKTSIKLTSPFSSSESRNHSSLSLNTPVYQGFPIPSDYHQYASQVFPRSSSSSNHSGSFPSSGHLSSPQATISPTVLDTNLGQEKSINYTDSVPKSSKKSSSGMFCHSFKNSVQSDVDYSTLTWSIEELIYIWRNVLCCLGNINNFQDPEHQELALRCVIDIYDSLQNVKSFRSPEGFTVPCDYEMATWIIQAADMSMSYNDGRVIAYEWMCRILSNRRAHEKIIVSYSTPFYRLLLKGWSRVDESFFRILVNVGTNVFSRDLAGVNFLAPVAITTIVNLFLENKETHSKDNELLHQNAITTLASLLHLPYQFKDLLLPSINYHQLSQGEVAPSIPVEDTKIQIQTVLLFLLNEDEWSSHIENFPGTFGMVICALCVQVTHELIWQQTSSQFFIQKSLTAILDQLYSSNHVLANVAIDCISSFAPSASSFYMLDSKSVSGILEDIIGALNVHLNLYNDSSSPENRYVLTRLFACLLEWLMVIPQHLLSDPHLEKLVLGTLDRGIQSGVTDETERSRNEPSHFAIKDAAQMVLMHLINHFGQEQAFSNGSFLNTNFTEPEGEDDSKYQYLGFNDTTIFTLYPTGEHVDAAIIVRNPLGKFAWNLGCENDVLTSNIDTSSSPPLNWTVPVRNQNIFEREEEEKAPLVEFEDFPEANPDEPILQKVDMVASTLDFLEKEFEASGSNDWIQTTVHKPNDVLSSLELPPEAPSIPVIDGSPVSKDEAQPCQLGANRLLFDNLKVATFSNFQSGQFVNINNGASFLRDLKVLDRKQSRETIKIGLVYVQQGQTLESNILCNESTSVRYQAFLESIGWEVDLTNHAGYMGGLEKTGANGTTSIYYSNSTLEIMFHDTTRMPNDPEDPQQVKKKRHIGNDPVHIIWNESRCDYSPYTIGGDFGNVQIIVHPLPNDMFDVRIFKDNQAVGYFGPLLNGMVLSKQILPNLIRTTAVNAYRSILCGSVGYHHNALNSSIQRAREIETIIRKHKSTTTPFEDIIANVYNVNLPTAASANS